MEKVQRQEVKHNQLLHVIMLLIERHVSAYSEAIIRFNKLQQTIYPMDLSCQMLRSHHLFFVWQYTEKNYEVRSCDGVPEAQLQITHGVGTLFLMSHRAGGRFRQWCQCNICGRGTGDVSGCGLYLVWGGMWWYVHVFAIVSWPCVQWCVCGGPCGDPRKKSTETPPGIDSDTSRLVAQYLNHYATPGLLLNKDK